MADPSKVGKLVPHSRRTYANVMATLALFIALGGSSYAAIQINGSQLKNRSIAGNKLKLHAVGAKDLNTHGVVVPTAQLSEKTADLLVPAPRSSRRRARRTQAG